MNIKTSVVNQPDSELMQQSVSVENLDFIDLCVERQNNKRARLIANKAAIEKHNEQERFYLNILKVGIVFALLIVLLCVAAREQAKIKTHQQQETEALLKQLEKGEVIEMTARIGAKP